MCYNGSDKKKILQHFLPDKLHHSQGSHAQFLFLQKKDKHHESFVGLSM
jgi:hypothetical protein